MTCEENPNLRKGKFNYTRIKIKQNRFNCIKQKIEQTNINIETFFLEWRTP